MAKVLAVILALIVVGGAAFLLMGKDDDTVNDVNVTQPTTTTPDATTPTEGTATEDTVQSGTVEVAIADMAFSPKTITVKQGTKIVWTNQDDVEHNVVSSGSGPLEGPLLGNGESYEFTFDETGTFDYFCEPHPNMTGSVVVVE